LADRRIAFPERAWEQIEALPESLRRPVQLAIFTLLDEPRPTLAEPMDGVPNAYELNLVSDDITIWYTITLHEGVEVITIQVVRPNL
ncbi:hypothetical protein JYK22_41340, partial [Nonomuraea sp. RK-328]|nr:hypothetical protein [Nonomuraea sp. RK-328]